MLIVASASLGSTLTSQLPDTQSSAQGFSQRSGSPGAAIRATTPAAREPDAITLDPGEPPDGHGQNQDGAYVWLDGDRIIPVRIENPFPADAGSYTATGTRGAVRGETPHQGNTQQLNADISPGEYNLGGSRPVTAYVVGEPMSMPGGVLVVLDPSWDRAEVDGFFTENEISLENVSARDFASNAFFVETAPGLPSLFLANALAVQEGVQLSSPNWQMEVETQQGLEEDDHGDTRATATDLALDTAIGGTISDVNDVDYFKFVLSESTYVVVADHSIARTATFGNSYTIYDADGALIKTGAITRRRLSAGTYYVEVGWFSEGFRRTNYHVEVKTIPDHSDTMEGAYSVEVAPKETAPQVFRDFHSSGDVDYFTFTLDEATDISIEVGEGLHVVYQGIGSIRAINLELFDSEGNALPPSVKGVSPFGRAYDLEAGTYYIRLTPYSLLGTYYGVNHLFPSDLYVYPNTEYIEFIDDCTAKASDFDDPLYGCQWHLKATGSNRGVPGEDINVATAWSTTKGAGVNVAIVDDETKFDHADLTDNWDSALSHDYLNADPDPKHWANHGLAIAGVIAARDNELGGRGVAPRATLFGHNFTRKPTLDNAIDALTRNRAATAVSNNSWVFRNTSGTYSVSQLWDAALERGITDGFDGKGTFYVFTAGNRAGEGLHVNLSEAKNHYAQTLVCGVQRNGERSLHKSETGYSLWLCAPEADVTTDLWDRYRDDFGGTSAAAAVVSGVAALLRSANGDLTWRDLKLILAASARKNDADDPGWEVGAPKYGSESDTYSYNHRYGFGVVDAGTAVTLADDWTNLPPMESMRVQPVVESQNIPDSDDGSSITSEVSLETDLTFTEFVEVRIDIDHPAFREISVTLTSPSGAESELAVPNKLAPDNGLHTKFRLGSARHLGENPSGTWTLEIEDHFLNGAGTFKGWEMTIYGHRDTPWASEIGQVTSSAGGITVTWTEPASTGASTITSYDLRYIQTDAADKSDDQWTVQTGIWPPSGGDSNSALTYALTDLEGGVGYDVQVRAVNGNGAGTWSATTTRRTGNTAPPEPPADVAAAPAASSLVVVWNPPAMTGGQNPTHYDVRYILTSGDETVDSNWTERLRAVTGSARRHTISGLANGMEYDVQVRAENSVGKGPWSETVNGTPADPPVPVFMQW